MLKRTARYAWLLFELCRLPAAVPAADEDLAPKLPPDIYAVVGQPLGIYYDNLVLCRQPELYRFNTVTCALGEAGELAWSVTPTAAQIATIPSRSRSPTRPGPSTAKPTPRSTSRRQTPARAPLHAADRRRQPDQCQPVPHRVEQAADGRGWPAVDDVGHQPRGGPESPVGHEGYGGWTWARFVSHYEPAPDGTTKKMSSPFVVPGRWPADPRRRPLSR